MKNGPEVFEKELGFIRHAEVREIVERCLGLAPERFWKDSASSSSKHHASDECVEGGLVLHTKRVVTAGMTLAPAYSIAQDSLDWDLVVGACILHDLVKYGTGQGPSYDYAAYKRHGPNVGVWYCEMKCVHFDELSDVETALFALTDSHMGPWSPEGHKPETPLQWCVFMADFVASRKQWSSAMGVL